MKMKRALLLVVFSAMVSPVKIASQEVSYGPGYQTIMLTNPAFAGTEGEGTLRLSYLDFYPGRNFNLHSFFASFDSFFPSLHGGATAFLSDDYLGGAVNDTRGGMAYSYHLQADRNLFIDAGLSASFFHRGFDAGRMIFPDQIDPLGGISGPTAELLNMKGRTVFDAGAGLLMIAGRYTAAVAVNHLTNPDISGSGSAEQRIGRELVIHMSGIFSLNTGKHTGLRPLVYGDFKTNRTVAGAGGSFEAPIISANAIVLWNRAGDLDLQTGIFLHLGNISFFYNYCFNISSTNSLLPASLVHNAGIVFSLHNVDKRKIIKTINFPKC